MPYWKSKPKNTRVIDNLSVSTNYTTNDGTGSEFYELESGVVLDIILDDTHPIFSANNRTYTKIDTDRWPLDVNNAIPELTDKDLSWIGRALIRPLCSGKNIKKDQLVWAYPMASNISEYPLINEMVVLSTYNGKLYYSLKLNDKNWINNNLDFLIEPATSGAENTELYTNSPYKGATSTIVSNKIHKNVGIAGKYFIANNRIRAIKRYEGDLAIESRHGQSIHMTAYDDNRANDIGDTKYEDYKNGHGNPMILIRNRQRPILNSGKKVQLSDSPNPATITGTPQEKNVGGYISENINHDGSSIHITSGQTISKWVQTSYTKPFGLNSGESDQTSFKFPTLNGDQIVIQSDRLIFSSRYGETFHHSKKRYSIFTDGEFTVNSHDQLILKTQNKAVISAPIIFLGEYDETSEPALLGQSTVSWLYELCNWMITHIHKHEHGHKDAGEASPKMTQTITDPQLLSLILLRDKLHLLLSRRVFLTGGGFAQGKNGISIPNGKSPININTYTGEGVPGGWKGTNYKAF